MKDTQDLVECPICQRVLRQEEDTCARCGQEFCPECRQPTASGAQSCFECGAEFGLFCSVCEEEVDAEASVCPHCGSSLETEAVTEHLAEDQNRDRAECPQCAAPVYLKDGYCIQCGATLCPACGKAIDEDVEICPHCETALFFDCQNCGFELTTGADQCPNCNAVIPNFCTACSTALPLTAQQCPACQANVAVQPRASARVIHSLVVADQVVQVAACPQCGAHFHLHQGKCGHCDYRACPKCQISLLPAEPFCPRCGPQGAQILASEITKGRCPNCLATVDRDSEQCAKCGQLLCPECQAAVTEFDTSCSQCGVEFEFECPQCGETLSAEATSCPHCGLDF